MGNPTSSTQGDLLPTDVAALQALLLAERAAAAKLAGQNEQLRAIVKELQRALFGRRSEKAAHPDQLQLALEDIEQALCRARGRGGTGRRDAESVAHPATSCQSWRTAQAPAARRDRHRARRRDLSLLWRCAAPDRRGRRGAARRDPGPVQGDRHPPAQIWLPAPARARWSRRPRRRG